MTLLAMERMKLFSTRSPWWCMALTTVAVIGFATVFAVSLDDDDIHLMTPSATQLGLNMGLIVMMVMAALAVTTEYRFGTMRATFLSVPSRRRVLLAKTAVVAVVAGVVGELVALASWGMGALLQPDAAMALTTDQQYRAIFGAGLYYALAAVIAVAVGLLVRHTAGAVALLLGWIFVVESLLTFLPSIGPAMMGWLPFVNGGNFLLAGQPADAVGQPAPPAADMVFGPWGSLGYLAAWAAVLLTAAIVLAKRRDA